jgi:hypothetical protein
MATLGDACKSFEAGRSTVVFHLLLREAIKERTN